MASFGIGVTSAPGTASTSTGAHSQKVSHTSTAVPSGQLRTVPGMTVNSRTLWKHRLLPVGVIIVISSSYSSRSLSFAKITLRRSNASSERLPENELERERPKVGNASFYRYHFGHPAVHRSPQASGNGRSTCSRKRCPGQPCGSRPSPPCVRLKLQPPTL